MFFLAFQSLTALCTASRLPSEEDDDDDDEDDDEDCTTPRRIDAHIRGHFLALVLSFGGGCSVFTTTSRMAIAYEIDAMIESSLL